MCSANFGPILDTYLQNIFEIVLGSFMTSFPLLNTSEILRHSNFVYEALLICYINFDI